MKIFKSFNFYKKLLFAGILVYVVCILLNQQTTLGTYKNREEYYEQQIRNEQNENEQLSALKENVDSKEYIEEIAREKLEMYLPNERVYIDIGR